MVKYPKNPAFTAKNTPPPPPDLGKGSARARNGNFFSRRLYYYDTEQKENQAILALAGGQSLQRWLLPIPKALEAIPIPNKPSVSPRRHPCTKKVPPVSYSCRKNLREPSRRTAVFYDLQIAAVAVSIHRSAKGWTARTRRKAACGSMTMNRSLTCSAAHRSWNIRKGSSAACFWLFPALPATPCQV